MSSYYLEDEVYELLFLKWIPNIVCCKCLNTKITFIIIAYIECLFFTYDVISGVLLISGFSIFSTWTDSGHFGSVANLFTTVLLIIGLHKDKKELIWIWLLIKEVWIIETLIIILAEFIFYPSVYLTVYSMVVGVIILIVLIIHSYYLTLSNQITTEASRPIAITMNNSSQLD